MATLTSEQITAKINAGEIVLLNCNNTLILINEVGDIPSVLTDCGFKEASLSEFTINGAPTNGQSLIYNSTTNKLDWITSVEGVSSVFARTGAVVAANNDYTWAQINKTTSSLADITTRSAADLNTGTLPLGRLSGITTNELSATAGITNAQLAGSIALTKLAITGTPDGTKYLRDDGSWQTIASSGNPAGSGSELQFRAGASAFGALTGSSTSGGDLGLAGTLTQTVNSANAFVVGQTGVTNPAFNVRTTAVGTGIEVIPATAGSGVTLGVTSSGANENLNVSAKGGTGRIYLISDTLANSLITGSSLTNWTQDMGYTTSLAFSLGSGVRIQWADSLNLSGSIKDLAILRSAAGVLRLSNASTGAGQLLIGTSTDTADAQLNVYSQSTTRPSLKLRALSGTSASQNVLESYDASGALVASIVTNGGLRSGSGAAGGGRVGVSS